MAADDNSLVVVERRSAEVGAFLLGAMLGAAAGLLLAPKSGRETQRYLRKGAKRLAAGAEEKLTEFREHFDEHYERAKAEVGKAVDVVREDMAEGRTKAGVALQAGKEAAGGLRQDFEERVAESKANYRARLAAAEGDGAAPSLPAGEDSAGDSEESEPDESPEAAS